jgi:DNA-binding response OmpR family regulator
MDMAEGNILLVEDDPSLREIITEALGDDGYAVASADNGATALELARRTPPDLAIVDLMMPRMDGEQFCSAVRQLSGLESLPIIVVSAARTTSEVGDRLGVAAALRKPFDLFELTDRVGDLLSGE